MLTKIDFCLNNRRLIQATRLMNSLFYFDKLMVCDPIPQRTCYSKIMFSIYVIRLNKKNRNPTSLSLSLTPWSATVTMYTHHKTTRMTSSSALLKWTLDPTWTLKTGQNSSPAPNKTDIKISTWKQLAVQRKASTVGAKIIRVAPWRLFIDRSNTRSSNENASSYLDPRSKKKWSGNYHKTVIILRTLRGSR